MLTQAFSATLKILLFRAGPQDFPYTEDPRLTRGCFAAAIAAGTLFFTLSMPLLQALLASIIAVAVLGMFTRMVLRLRGLDNRLPQTLNTLLALGTLLLVLLRLPVSVLMPDMLAYVAQVNQDPSLLDKPDRIPQFPLLPSLLADLLSIWFVAVTAHVFRQAANLGFAGSAFVALLCQFNIAMMLMFTAPLVALVGG